MPTLNDYLTDLSHAIVRGNEPSPQIAAHYRNYSAAIAIEVYRNNYRGNLHDTLAGAYPVTEQLVGKDFFRLMTRHFIGQYPSRSGNLHRYGAEMSSFVPAFKPAQGLPYLSDVAELEWACHIAYFADDAATIDIGKMTQIPPELYSDLILRTNPACRQIRSRYPIGAIWRAHQPGAACDFHIDLGSGPCNALVCRKDGVIQVIELAEAEATWLQRIQTGLPLGDATTKTLDQYPDFDLQTTLMYLVAQEVLTDFNLRTMK